MEQLPALLALGAEAFGFRGQVWTTARVVEMIRQQFGVSYHRAHGSRLLRRLKQSRQKTIQKATQRDEDSIAAWKEERWPALKKRPKRKNGR
jgi:transposase